MMFSLFKKMFSGMESNIDEGAKGVIQQQAWNETVNDICNSTSDKGWKCVFCQGELVISFSHYKRMSGLEALGVSVCCAQCDFACEVDTVGNIPEWWLKKQEKKNDNKDGDRGSVP